jgi:N-acetylmuramoyl-L-alanine amidase/D-alanyl-D-alanine carboxypeptidase
MNFDKIAIDCGHGASPDTGASSILVEDAVVKDVGEALQAEFKLRGKQVIMCRPRLASSVQDSLTRRIQASNQSGADLYLSIHCNAYQATDKPMGAEVFAISDRAKKIAARVETNISGQGWKSRGVKDGSHLFVLKYTQAPAILIELFFVDSKADCLLYKNIGAAGMATAIASAVLGEAPLNQPSAITMGKTLGQFIDEGGCSTAGMMRLNAGLIAATDGAVSTIAASDKIELNDSAVNLALAHGLIDSFWAVVNDYNQQYGKPLRINSLYRTAVQQICLYEWFRRGKCGISACACPGTSNHEAGQAIDVEDYEKARYIFKKFGWVWQMDKSGNDPVHFEKDLGAEKVSVLALQKYWNRYNPTDQIAEDNQYGAKTREKALLLPINGY